MPYCRASTSAVSPMISPESGQEKASRYLASTGGECPLFEPPRRSAVSANGSTGSRKNDSRRHGHIRHIITVATQPHAHDHEGPQEFTILNRERHPPGSLVRDGSPRPHKSLIDRSLRLRGLWYVFSLLATGYSHLGTCNHPLKETSDVFTYESLSPGVRHSPAGRGALARDHLRLDCRTGVGRAGTSGARCHGDDHVRAGHAIVRH